MIKFPFILFLASFLHTNGIAQTHADSLLNFIARSPAKSSLHLVVNDTAFAAFMENKKMPLASTMKMLIALEFAKQSAAGLIDTGKVVALRDLHRYYLPYTDGNAHPQWMQYEKQMNHVINDSLKLIHVARGMMMFSSNANTDFLLQLLGIENVQNNTKLLALREHGLIVPMAASLFLYQNPKNKKEQDILRGIRMLTDADYTKYILNFHRALAQTDEVKKRFRPQDLSPLMQRLWSDRLPSSTTREYTQLANVLNNRKFFSPSTYEIFSRVAETVMENPANMVWLKHAGMKGGSTQWVLTKCIYATDKKGNRIELAYFFNNLETAEYESLQKWMNSFELEVISDPAFRSRMARLLNNL